MATNDLHYTLADDAKPHDVLLCIQQQKLQSDPKRLRFDAEEFYLKSAAEMRHVFRELPEACDMTLAIAERVQPIPELERVLVEHKTDYHLPRFDTPARRAARGLPPLARRRGRPRPLRRPAAAPRWPSGSTASSASSTRWGSRATS